MPKSLDVLSVVSRSRNPNGKHCTKMKFSIKDFFNKCDQTVGNCGFGHIY